MYTYFMVLNDFGVRPSTLFGLSGIKAPVPKPDDVWTPGEEKYDSNRMYTNINGNTNVASGDKISLGWDLTRSNKIDIRLFYSYNFERKPEDWTKCRWAPDDESLPRYYRISSVSDYPICYSTEALKYAQAAYLVSIVVCQAAGLISAKTRNLSLYQQGMINMMGNFGLFSEFALVSFLLYVKPLNLPLGTRQIPLPHFAVPSLTFYISIFFYDELRKLYIRKGMVKENGRFRQRGWIV